MELLSGRRTRNVLIAKLGEAQQSEIRPFGTPEGRIPNEIPLRDHLVRQKVESRTVSLAVAPEVSSAAGRKMLLAARRLLISS